MWIANHLLLCMAILLSLLILWNYRNEQKINIPGMTLIHNALVILIKGLPMVCLLSIFASDWWEVKANVASQCEISILVSTYPVKSESKINTL